MKRLRKSSSRVSWAPPPNLCQVKLFVSEDSPSIVGQKSQDRLQAKVSSMLHSSTIEFSDLPPGFECHPLTNQSKHRTSCVPQTTWRCPPPFVFSYNWHVVAGEESREKEDQKRRELRVLEAVYPRLSSIPPSPSVALDVEEEDYDDNITPLVPVIPIEEEESMDDRPAELPAAREAPGSVQSKNLHHQQIKAPIRCDTSSLALTSSGISPGLEVDLAAASAVVSAILKSSEQGNLIDMDLLVKIFNDPLMIEKLVNDLRTTAATPSTASAGTIPISGPKFAASSASLSSSRFGPEIQPISSSSTPMSVSLPLQGPTPMKSNCYHHMPIGSLDSQPPQHDAFLVTGAATHTARSSLASIPWFSPGEVRSFTGKEANSVKDANYLKNLIRQHGSVKKDMLEEQIGNRHSNFQNLKSVPNNDESGEVKNKIQKKTCVYFNSSRGCRNGSSCPYQHDMSIQWGSKRLKLEQKLREAYKA